MDIQTVAWMHEHSYFCAVDVPGDVEFVEFVMSDSYGLERFMRESKEAGVSFQEYTNNKYREWRDEPSLRKML